MPERIHILHSSQLYSLNRDQIREDAVVTYGRNAHVVATTESEKDPVRGVMIRQAAKFGYQIPGKDLPGGGLIALREDCEVVAAGYSHVLDPRKTRPGAHGHRGVHWVQFISPGGNLCSHQVAHWLTGTALGSNPTDNIRREERNILLTNAMILEVSTRAMGDAIAFWSADTNVDEVKDTGADPTAPHAKFTAAGLLSIYDELGVYPDTHGKKTLDVIGRHRSDLRVSPNRVRVHPRQNKDHRDVSAWYTIADLPVPPAPTTHACPLCSNEHIISTPGLEGENK